MSGKSNPEGSAGDIMSPRLEMRIFNLPVTSETVMKRVQHTLILFNLPSKVILYWIAIDGMHV